MEYNEYLEHVKKTINYDLSNKDMFENACYGLIGETGEVADILKKAFFQGHKLDKEKLIDELGDCFWYLTFLGWVISENKENKNISEDVIKNKKSFIYLKKLPFQYEQISDCFNESSLKQLAYILQRIYKIIIYEEHFFYIIKEDYILNIIDIIEEISELYISLLKNFCPDKTLDDVLNHNILKLSLRYKNGFDSKCSIERKGNKDE